MILRTRGGAPTFSFLAFSFLASRFLEIGVLLLAGCAGPVNQREAETLASRSLRKFCAASPCGAPRLVKTERLKDRWMVDFDAPNGLYTVAVDRSGNTEVTAWDKNSPK